MSVITELVTRILSSLGITGDTPTGAPGNAGPGGGGGAVGSPDQKPDGSLGGALGADLGEGLGGLLGDSLGENLPVGLGSDLAGSLTGGLGGLAGGLGNLGGLTDGLGDLGGLAGGLGGQLDDLQGVVEDLTGRVQDLEQPGQGADPDPEQAGGVDPAGDQPAILPTGGDRPTDPSGDGDRPDMGGPANPQTWMSAALASGDHRGLDVQSGGWRPQPLTYGPPQSPDQPQAWQPGTWLGADPTTGPGGYLTELTRAVMTAAHTSHGFPPARLPGPAGAPAPALAGGNGGSGGLGGGPGGGWRGGDTAVTGHDQPTTTHTGGGADLDGTHAATAHQDRMDWLAAAHGFHDPHNPTANSTDPTNTSSGPTRTGGQARLVGNGMAVPTRDGDTLTLTPTTTSPHARTSPDLARGRYLIHIDNAAAPGSYDFALDMPTGAHAVENPQGGVDVLGAGGDTIQTIAAPWAKDANGADLPTRFQVSTGPDGTTTLTQHVAFDDTTAFPVLADPDVAAAAGGADKTDAAQEVADTGGGSTEGNGEGAEGTGTGEGETGDGADGDGADPTTGDGKDDGTDGTDPAGAADDEEKTNPDADPPAGPVDGEGGPAGGGPVQQVAPPAPAAPGEGPVGPEGQASGDPAGSPVVVVPVAHTESHPPAGPVADPPAVDPPAELPAPVPGGPVVPEPAGAGGPDEPEPAGWGTAILDAAAEIGNAVASLGNAALNSPGAVLAVVAGGAAMVGGGALAVGGGGITVGTGGILGFAGVPAAVAGATLATGGVVSFGAGLHQLSLNAAGSDRVTPFSSSTTTAPNPAGPAPGGLPGGPPRGGPPGGLPGGAGTGLAAGAGLEGADAALDGPEDPTIRPDTPEPVGPNPTIDEPEAPIPPTDPQTAPGPVAPLNPTPDNPGLPDPTKPTIDTPDAPAGDEPVDSPSTNPDGDPGPTATNNDDSAEPDQTQPEDIHDNGPAGSGSDETGPGPAHPGGEETPAQRDDRRAGLSFDPDKNSVTTNSEMEGADAARLEDLGILDRPRRADPNVPHERGADFLDADGQLWDHKRAISGRNFDAGAFVDKVYTYDILSGEKIILNQSQLTEDDRAALQAAIDARGLGDQFVFVPDP